MILADDADACLLVRKNLDSQRAYAGKLDIDIPFNLLSKTVIDPEDLLDRQIAANLKLNTLLTQYLAMKKRNAKLLKDLRIPYLEEKRPIVKTQRPAPDSFEPAGEMKKKMEEVILFYGKGRQVLPGRQAVVLYGESEGNDGKNGIRGDSSVESKVYSFEAAGGGLHQISSGNEVELPWVFRAGLGLLRFVSENKMEIFVWFTVAAMAGLVGLLVVKR